LEDNQWEDAILIPKNRGEKFSSRFLHSKLFWGGVNRYAAIPLIVALSPGHSDITRFLPCLPIATGNHLDRAEKIPKFAQTTGTVDFLIRVQAFWDPLRGMNDGPNLLT